MPAFMFLIHFSHHLFCHIPEVDMLDQLRVEDIQVIAIFTMNWISIQC